MKNPHPSGRPVRHTVKAKPRRIWFDYPAETFGTPRLRPKATVPVADAIGYHRVYPVEEITWPLGFVDFSKR